MKRWALVAALIPFAAAAPAAAAQDKGKKPPAPAAADEDPPLSAEEQKKHDAEVKATLAELRAQKNKDRMQDRIGQMGAQGGRVHRDVLMAFAKGNKNHEFVDSAFQALAKIGGSKVVDYLAADDALGAYNNFLVQVAAAKALGEMGNPRAAPALVATMLNPRTKIEVASACCQAAAKAAPQDPKVAAGVLQLSKAKDDTLRANAVEALGGLGSQAAYDRLIEALQKDGNTRVRGAAAKGLGVLGRKEALPALQVAAAEDKGDSVRTLAMEAIKALGGVSK